jgi:hypothetical protein
VLLEIAKVINSLFSKFFSSNNNEWILEFMEMDRDELNKEI